MNINFQKLFLLHVECPRHLEMETICQYTNEQQPHPHTQEPLGLRKPKFDRLLVSSNNIVF